MRKIFAILLAMMLIASMAVSAFAVTPTVKYTPVKIPEIKVSVKIPNNVFDSWFKENPLNTKLPIT